MNKNSNAYIFIYASVMVVLVAVILTSANLALKPLQEKNKKDEKMINLLLSVGIEANAENASELYNKFLVKEIVVDKSGNELSAYANGTLEKGDTRAFDINLKASLKDIEKGGEGQLPLFLMENDGEIFYVIPVLGKGLWGPVYGNVALKDDKNTIAGVNFGHDGETPGLGAEIILPFFTDRFKQKTIFDADGSFKSVKVVKGGVANQSAIAAEHGVDGISGSTLTCDGVSNMLEDCLGNYVNYFKNN